ncbi:MAG: glutamate--tRNA ligase family protein, partial [Saprospiraceae bacterium]
GLLHIGNGVNFALTAAWAHALLAEVSLRIDDLDGARVRGEFYNDIADTIRWMDLDPLGQVFAKASYQANRLGRYEEVLDSLRQNNLVYACTCSRKQIRDEQEESGGDINAYPGTCRDAEISLDAPNVTWRLKLEEGGVAVTWLEGLGKGAPETSTQSTDFVIRQRNGRPSYQLASVVDDIDMGITHIVRGKDLWDSTIMQLVLAKALLAEVFPQLEQTPFEAFAKTRFWHHDLVADLQGRKLSKSDGDSSLRYMRDRRWGSDIVYREAGLLMDVAAVNDKALLSDVIYAKG